MVFLLPVFIFDTIKLSHRFAGPVLRLRNEMRAVADGGELRRLSFRKGDFWHSLAEDYNALLDRFETDKEVTVYNETVVDEVAEPVCSV
jgi:hypothetical protein